MIFVSTDHIDVNSFGFSVCLDVFKDLGSDLFVKVWLTVLSGPHDVHPHFYIWHLICEEALQYSKAGQKLISEDLLGRKSV